MSWRDRVFAGVTDRGGDAVCCLVALFIGGVATDSTEVATSSYAAVNEMVGLAAIFSQ